MDQSQKDEGEIGKTDLKSHLGSLRTAVLSEADITALKQQQNPLNSSTLGLQDCAHSAESQSQCACV